MKIAAKYSFNGGADMVGNEFADELAEIVAAIESIDAESHRTKKSKEKTMPGRMLYSPQSIIKPSKTFCFRVTG